MLSKIKIEELQAELEQIRAHPENSKLDQAEITGSLKILDRILDPKQKVLNEEGDWVRLYPD